MTYRKQVEAAVEHLRSVVSEAPELVLILGSGLSSFADRLENATTISYEEIPHWPTSTVVGHRGALVCGTLHGKRIAAMAGRIHLYEGHDAKTITFPVRVLATWGAKTLLVTNSAGGIAESLQPGDLMLITDHLNLQGTNPLIGENDDDFGVRFPDMTAAYDPKLQAIARAAGVPLKEGVYAALTGPSYETPAEVQMVRTLGADAVGMSTVPEVIVARHMGLRVLGISCISNLAAGLSATPLTHEEVTATAASVREEFQKLVDAIIERM